MRSKDEVQPVSEGAGVRCTSGMAGQVPGIQEAEEAAAVSVRVRKRGATTGIDVPGAVFDENQLCISWSVQPQQPEC